MSKALTGYNMALRQRLRRAGKDEDKAKGREMANVVIDKNGSRYFAKGRDKEFEDDVICCALGEEKALEAIKNGVAKKGKGW